MLQTNYYNWGSIQNYVSKNKNKRRGSISDIQVEIFSIGIKQLIFADLFQKAAWMLRYATKRCNVLDKSAKNQLWGCMRLSALPCSIYWGGVLFGRKVLCFGILSQVRFEKLHSSLYMPIWQWMSWVVMRNPQSDLCLNTLKSVIKRKSQVQMREMFTIISNACKEGCGMRIRNQDAAAARGSSRFSHARRGKTRALLCSTHHQPSNDF